MSSADAGREIEVRRVGLADLEPLREEYRRAAGCQIVHDSALPRGLADPYLLLVGGEVAAYAGIWSRYYPGRVMEFHTQRPMGPGGAERLFDALLAATGATHVEAQSNMPLMLAMLRARGANVVEEKVLFEDGPGTDLRCPGAVLRPSSRDERLEGEFALDVDGVVVAHGGILCHYNPPYSDLYMEVAEGARRRGYGAFLVQELRRICHAAGLVPAARCDPSNVASRRTLERAGMRPCGHLLAARVSCGVVMPPRPTMSAPTRANTVTRSERWRDARWAPWVWTGKILASSLPEHRADTR